MINEWFSSRGLETLPYQQAAITEVQQSLRMNQKTVLAASPSAGKTLMTICLIDEYLVENPNHKVLVLTHGTTVLRSQFDDNLETSYPDRNTRPFEFSMPKTGEEYTNSTSQVIVCLPQTLDRLQTLQAVDLLVVDEAHQFYFADMIKDIIKKTGVVRQLLLTGTPSKFIYENSNPKNKNPYKIIPVSMNTIFDAGMVSDLYVEIASSSYSYTMDDYTTTDELKQSVTFKQKDTNNTLDSVLEKLTSHLKDARDNPLPNSSIAQKVISLANPAAWFSDIGKTMIACRRIEQAVQVQKYFGSKGIGTALSTSEDDLDSSEIDTFRKEPKCRILIVVGRGVLGFDFSELVHVVDMTGSRNIDRIYQLMARVVRVNKKAVKQKKLFIKISPNALTDYFKHIMTATLMLTEEEFLLKYNGKNFDDMMIHIKKAARSSKTASVGTSRVLKNKSKFDFKPIDMSKLPVLSFFKDILHQKDQPLSVYGRASFRDIRAQFAELNGGKMPNRYWNLDTCKESALKFTTRSEWMKGENSPYSIAHKNGWLDECCGHMEELQKPNGYWNPDRCKESALKYKTRMEWDKGECSAYRAAQKNGGLEECCGHMEELQKPKRYWHNLDKCKESALKYKKRGAWQKGETSAYQTAFKNGWLDECCGHMEELQKPNRYWNLDTCKESALKYKTRMEWHKGDRSAYQGAQKYGCLDECCGHMEEIKKPNRYWNLDRCKESALKYKTRSEWFDGERSGYVTAAKSGWMEECCGHMVEIQKPHGYWNLDRCKESALKYKTRMEWNKGEGGAYDAAHKNGWLDECCGHMKKRNASVISV